MNSNAPYSLILKFRQRGLSRVCALFALLFLVAGNKTWSQIPFDSLYARYGLVREEDNVIHNAAYLDQVFESLFQQLMLNDRTISMVHIGDSHIQADYLTAVMRRSLQKQFGNAGRGLIVPFEVAGTNGPFNLVSRSNTKWKVKRCVSLADSLPVGIGGITIQTDQPDAEIEFHMNDLWMDYSFDSITLFFLEDDNAFDFAFTDTTGAIVANTQPSTLKRNYARVLLPHSTSAIRLKTIRNIDKQNHATIFGFNLQNGNNGVLYHAIGVNGAKYEHYNAAGLFARQTCALNPSIFIISLGTNEAISYPYLDKSFPSHVDRLINTLRSSNPQAKFILVTPPDGFRKKNKHNPGLRIIRQQLLDYAVENGLAFYDLYKAGGGDQSAAAWRDKELLRSDGIHFTKKGYEYQGYLFYDAFMKAYNNYVLLRHP